MLSVSDVSNVLEAQNALDTTYTILLRYSELQEPNRGVDLLDMRQVYQILSVLSRLCRCADLMGN